MNARATPAAEVAIDRDLVGRLVALQLPDLASEPVTFLADGWDNALFRVGDRHVARLPRRSAAVALLDHEVRWLPEIASGLPLPVPVPLFVGAPGAGYPWRWTLVPWFEGEPIGAGELDGPATADALGAFLRSLHRIAPPDAPRNPFRSIPLADRFDSTVDRVRSLAAADEPAFDAARLLELWDRSCHVAAAERPRTWIHGDLHPLNVLAVDGRPTAVIDFGDVAAGDPATDLAVAWMLFDRPDLRARLYRAYGGVDATTDLTARGWALTLGAAMLAGSRDDSMMATIGRRALRHVVDDPARGAHEG